MTSFFSIISTQTNSFSGENIAVGLVFVTPEKVFFKYAPSKLTWLKKLNLGEEISDLAETGLKNIEKAVKEHNEKGPSLFKSIFSKEYFDYLNQYANGAIVFSKPEALPISVNKQVFNEYFEKMIGLPPFEEKKINVFQQKVKKIFKAQNADSFADINLILKVNQIEGILKDTRIPLITKNGSVKAIEVLDFTQTKENIIANIYEAQILHWALQQFCHTKGLKMDKLKLAFEEPKGKQQKTIFDLVHKEKKGMFELNALGEVEEFLKEAARSEKYSKFSEVLKEEKL